MLQKPADEFLVRQGNELSFRCAVIPRAESDGVIPDSLDASVGNGNAVCVTPEVIDGIVEAVKGLLDVRTPVFL